MFESHKKVSFNIASEASYVYILSGQKLIKSAKNGQFLWVFENLKITAKQCYQIGPFQSDKHCELQGETKDPEEKVCKLMMLLIVRTS